MWSNTLIPAPMDCFSFVPLGRIRSDNEKIIGHPGQFNQTFVKNLFSSEGFLLNMKSDKNSLSETSLLSNISILLLPNHWLSGEAIIYQLRPLHWPVICLVAQNPVLIKSHMLCLMLSFTILKFFGLEILFFKVKSDMHVSALPPRTFKGSGRAAVNTCWLQLWAWWKHEGIVAGMAHKHMPWGSPKHYGD